jgi:hypothetical protein
VGSPDPVEDLAQATRITEGFSESLGDLEVRQVPFKVFPGQRDGGEPKRGVDLPAGSLR